MRTFLLPLVITAACRSPDASTDAQTNSDDGGALAPESCDWTAAEDLDPSPDVVEVEFSAAPVDWDSGNGVPIHGMGFGGTVPGPRIEVTVGQTLRVRFHNNLNQPTTIHWHGLRVPEAMDGIVQMEHPVQPGDTFVYEFKIKDAGFYWYHPHMDTATTLEAGLYGTIVARAPGEQRPSCEQPLVLDDVLVNKGDGQIKPAGTDMDKIMGRLGNILLANGRSDRDVAIKAGDVVVLRLVNAANARYFDVGIDGVAFTVLASDGGFLPEAKVQDRLRLAPGERAIVMFTAPEAIGQELVLMNRRVHLHEEGASGGMMMSEYDPLGDGENPVMRFTVVDGGTEATWAAPSFDLPPEMTAGEPAHTWVLNENMMAGSVTIDGASWPDVPMVDVVGDERTTFVIDNKSEMRHPFHIHGNRFEVVSIGGEAVTEPAWKDTFDVPPRTAITVVSDLDNAGTWMYHCHILEHAEAGMAGMITVE